MFSFAKVHFVFLFLLRVMQAKKNRGESETILCIFHRPSREWMVCVTHGKKERKRKVIEEEVMDGYRRERLPRTQKKKNGKDEKIFNAKKRREADKSYPPSG